MKGKTFAGPAAHQIPAEILEDPLLNEAIKLLPANYSLEIHKTIHHVRKNNATMVALQMPEGLQMFACTIADIVEQYDYSTLDMAIGPFLLEAMADLPARWL